MKTQQQASPVEMEYPSKFVCIDPGHATGIAVYNNRELVWVSTVQSSILTSREIELFYTVFEPEAVFLESVPIQNTDKLTQELYYRFLVIAQLKGIRISSIPPGTWKPFTGQRKLQFGEHAEDAAKLGLYVLEHLIP